MSDIGKIDKKNVCDVLALSPIQESILFHYISNKDSELYFAQLSLSIIGSINLAVLKEAIDAVTDNNEMLRTVFRWDGLKAPVQIVLDINEIPIYEYDFSIFDENEALDKVRILKRKQKSKRINICTNPIYLVLCKINQCTYEMIINWHHILYDGWSNAILIKEFFDVYHCIIRGIRSQKVAKSKYKEFVSWCQNVDYIKQEQYWVEYFKGFTIKTLLPVDKEKQDSASNQSQYFSFVFSEYLLSKIEKLTKSKDITLSSMLYGAWAILLYKYTGLDDIIFGTTVSGRSIPIKSIENMIGLFINTLPLRVKLTETTCILDILNNIKHCLEERVDYEVTPFSKIKACSQINPRDTLFDSVVVVENYPIDANVNITDKENTITLSNFNMVEKADFDLVLGILPYNNLLTFQYNINAFSKENIEKISKHFLYIMEAMVLNPEAKLTEIDLMYEGKNCKFESESIRLKEDIKIDFDF